MCDGELQDRIISCICEVVQRCNSALHSGWRSIFAALRSIKVPFLKEMDPLTDQPLSDSPTDVAHDESQDRILLPSKIDFGAKMLSTQKIPKRRRISKIMEIFEVSSDLSLLKSISLILHNLLFSLISFIGHGKVFCGGLKRVIYCSRFFCSLTTFWCFAILPPTVCVAFFVTYLPMIWTTLLPISNSPLKFLNLVVIKVWGKWKVGYSITVVNFRI